MSVRVRLSRRGFLRASTLSAIGAAVAACAQPTPVIVEKQVPVEKVVKETVVVEKQVPVEKVVKETVVVEKEQVVEKVVTATPVPSRFKEAPMLAELVKAGKLPPVDERLPQNPCVVPVMEMVGKYGGTLRRGFTGVSDRVGPWKMTANQLIWFNADLSLRANVCEGWEINGDASQWTFKLRKGMKWSDGKPFTSAAFQWWYDNVLMNKTLTPSVSANWYTGKKVVMQMTSPDEYTVVLKFADPNPLFVYAVTASDPFAPGHYMAQFHMDLTSDKQALEKAMKDGNYATWDQLYGNRNEWSFNPERPTLNTWVAINPINEELFVMERNPYCFLVDKEGNQLPYIDKMVHRLFGTKDVFNMWIIGGEIDFQQRHVDVPNYTLFKENETKGNYRVIVGADDSTNVLCINHTCKDPRIREFFQDRNVRIALSHALNRKEINELIYEGLTTPRQYSPPRQSPDYYEKLTNAYIEYDPDKANQLLDQAGYKRGADGYRRWKDGSGRISLVMENYSPTITDEGEVIVRQLEQVGIQLTYQVVERSLGTQHENANELQMEHHFCSRAVLPLADPAFFIASSQDKSWCKAWTLWFNNPDNANAEEPPKGHFIYQLREIWNRVRLEPSETKQHEIMREMWDILAEEIPMPGTVGELPAPMIWKNGLRNLDPKYVMPISNTTKHDGMIPLATYFWEEPEKHV